MFSVWIPLSQNKIVVVDRDDAARVNAFKWYAHQSRGRFYAARQTPREGGKNGKYVAYTRIEGKRIHLGSFPTAEAASVAYEEAVRARDERAP